MIRCGYCLLLAALAPAPSLAQPVAGLEVIEPGERQKRQLQALTPERVLADINVSDDDLDTVATLTSEKVWSSRGGLTARVRSDNFLRAFIGKTSGEVRYQLYQEVTYGDDWRRFSSVNYATPSGPARAEVNVITREVVTCDYGSCVFREVIGFDLSRELMEEIAAGYTPGNSTMWRFRFRGQNGLDWEDRIAPAEAAGMLLAVDRYLEQHASAGEPAD